MASPKKKTPKPEPVDAPGDPALQPLPEDPGAGVYDVTVRFIEVLEGNTRELAQAVYRIDDASGRAQANARAATQAIAVNADLMARQGVFYQVVETHFSVLEEQSALKAAA